jgi:hypothetical protein
MSALTQWHREVERGSRSRFVFDALWHEACVEAAAREHAPIVELIEQSRATLAALNAPAASRRARTRSPRRLTLSRWQHAIACSEDAE